VSRLLIARHPWHKILPPPNTHTHDITVHNPTTLTAHTTTHIATMEDENISNFVGFTGSDTEKAAQYVRTVYIQFACEALICR
jgi:hypothetical protein